MEHDIRALYKKVKELDESLADTSVSISSLKGEPNNEYLKWGKNGGIEAWKKHIEAIFGPLDYTHKADIRGRDDFSQTKALKHGKEVGTFSHFNNSSSNLLKEVDELDEIKRLFGH